MIAWLGCLRCVGEQTDCCQSHAMLSQMHTLLARVQPVMDISISPGLSVWLLLA